jgi:hypothetical protein
MVKKSISFIELQAMYEYSYSKIEANWFSADNSSVIWRKRANILKDKMESMIRGSVE